MNHAAFMDIMQLLVCKAKLKNTVSMAVKMNDLSNTEKVVISQLWVSKKRSSLAQ